MYPESAHLYWKTHDSDCIRSQPTCLVFAFLQFFVCFLSLSFAGRPLFTTGWWGPAVKKGWGGGGAGGLVREKEEAEYVSEYSKPLRRKDIEAGTDMVDSRAEGWRCT